MTINVLILGAKGQVGVDVAIKFSHDSRFTVQQLSREQIDLVNTQDILPLVNQYRPDIIINAAGYTQVDKAESEPDLALLLNATVPELLAQYSHTTGALLIHISTDYVFSGKSSSAYAETATPAPLNLYGKTKLEGEKRIQAACHNYVILRTSWVFGLHGKNFVNTMLSLAQNRTAISVVADQMGNPTYAGDIADVMYAIAVMYVNEQQDFAPGTYHYSGDSTVSWYALAQTIFTEYSMYSSTIPTLTAIPTSQYPTPAVRPANSALLNDKIVQTFNVSPSNWQQGIKTLVKDFHENY